MKLQDNYDWIVLGDHPGALLSACLAARLGFSVLVLPLGPSPKATVTSSGQCLDPESNFLLGLGETSLSAGILIELFKYFDCISIASGQVRSGIDSVASLLTPLYRVGLFSINGTWEELERELQREFGPNLMSELSLVRALRSSERNIYDFWKQFPKSSRIKPQDRLVPETIEKVIVGANLDLKQCSDRVLEIYQGLLFASLLRPSETIHPAHLTHLFTLARMGASFRGGLSHYRKYLLQVARSLGAQTPSDIECMRILVEDNRFVGVQLSQKARIIGARGGLLGCSLEQAGQKVCVTGKGKGSRLHSGVQPLAWKFTVALTVHAEALPPGVSPRSVWIENGAPGIEIEISHPSDYEMGYGYANHRLLFVRTSVPFHPDTLSVSFQKKLAARLYKQVEEIFPFIEYHTLGVFPDFRKVESESEFVELYGFGHLSEIPPTLLCYDGVGIGFTTGIDELFCANDESYPFLGSLGPTVAAIESILNYSRTGGLNGWQA